MSRVIHFEIPASDPTEYWMVNTGAEGTPGINGGLMKNTDVKTTTNTIGVESVDGAVDAVTKAGGTL